MERVKQLSKMLEKFFVVLPAAPVVVNVSNLSGHEIIGFASSANDFNRKKFVGGAPKN